MCICVYVCKQEHSNLSVAPSNKLIASRICFICRLHTRCMKKKRGFTCGHIFAISSISDHISNDFKESTIFENEQMCINVQRHVQ